VSDLLQLENKGVEELLQPFIRKVDAKPEADSRRFEKMGIEA
jgi:hypothetical protein